MDLQKFEQRKKDHITQSLRDENQATGGARFEDVRLIHEALPEINFDEITLETKRLGRPVSVPFYVCGMTAGHAGANEINEKIASVCERRGWAMGVGSQRRELTEKDDVDHWSEFKDRFSRLEVYGNIGISQAIVESPETLQKLVDGLGARGLFIHLNALQEVIQPEGTPQFKGGVAAIERLSETLSVPVLLKETGCGFSIDTLNRLAQVNVAAIDVSGYGGTHWGRIEGARAQEKSFSATAAQTFRGWGVSTLDSVMNAVKSQGKWEIWASGGVRNGLDAAKLIALGADQVGFAQPVLRAVMESEAALEHWMEQVEKELKVALFCTGCDTLESLRGKIA